MDKRPAYVGLLVVIQVLRPAKHSMQNDNDDHNQDRNQHVQPHIGEHQSNYRDNRQRRQNDTIVNLAIEDSQRFIAKEVEEAPGGKHQEEDYHGDRVPHKAEEQDEEEDERVINLEVAKVSLNEEGGFAEHIGAREGGE